MEYGDKFKKSLFGGFNRKDVLACVAEMNAHHLEELTDEREEKLTLKKQLEELQKELESKCKENLELQEKNDARTKDFAACEEKINRAIETGNDMKQRLEEKQAQLQSMRAVNSELSVKRSLLEENNRVLKQRVDELEEERQGKKVSFEIGEMMVEAKKTADGIVNRANEKAVAAQSAAEAETADIAASLADIRVQLSEAATDFKSYSADIIKSLEEMQRTIERSRARLSEPSHGKGEAKQTQAPSSRTQPSGAAKSRQEGKDAKNPYGFLFKK